MRQNTRQSQDHAPQTGNYAPASSTVPTRSKRKSTQPVKNLNATRDTTLENSLRFLKSLLPNPGTDQHVYQTEQHGLRVHTMGPKVNDYVKRSNRKLHEATEKLREQGFYDFPYRAHPQSMDDEYFKTTASLREKGLSKYEEHLYWREMASLHQVEQTDTVLSRDGKARVKKAGFTVTGNMPLTIAAPVLASGYQDVNFEDIRKDKPGEIKRQKETRATASARAYEHDFLKNVRERAPLDVLRAFIFPDSVADSSMMTALGGSLDSNVGTSGNTMGAGKTYSLIYTHFRRALEDVHKGADRLQNWNYFEESKPYQEDRFKSRTEYVVDNLDPIGAMKANESEYIQNINKVRGTQRATGPSTASIDRISSGINDLMLRHDDFYRANDVSKAKNPASMFSAKDFSDLIKQPQTEDDPITAKQHQMIASIIGLKIKAAKHHILSHYTINSEISGEDSSHVLDDEVSKQSHEKAKKVMGQFRDLISLTAIEHSFNNEYLADKKMKDLLEPLNTPSESLSEAKKEAKAKKETEVEVKTPAKSRNKRKREKEEEEEEDEGVDDSVISGMRATNERSDGESGTRLQPRSNDKSTAKKSRKSEDPDIDKNLSANKKRKRKEEEQTNKIRGDSDSSDVGSKKQKKTIVDNSREPRDRDSGESRLAQTDVGVAVGILQGGSSSGQGRTGGAVKRKRPIRRIPEESDDEVYDT